MTEAIEPSTVDFKLNDVDYTIKPITVGQVPRLLRLLGPAISEFSGGALDKDLVVTMLSEHGDQLLEAVALMSNAPQDVVGAMTPDDFIALAMAVVEVNTDFFVNRLVPTMEDLPEKITDLKASIGSTQSSD